MTPCYYGLPLLRTPNDVTTGVRCKQKLTVLPSVHLVQTGFIFYHYTVIQHRHREIVALDQKNSLSLKVKTMKLVKGLRKQLYVASMVTSIFAKIFSLSFNNIIGVFIRLLNFFL